LRGHGHASGRISITQFSITAGIFVAWCITGKTRSTQDLLFGLTGGAWGLLLSRSGPVLHALYRRIRTNFQIPQNRLWVRRHETSVVSGRGSLTSAERGDPSGPAAEGTAARGTDKTHAHRLARAALGPLVRQFSMDETSDDGTSPARLRRHQAGEASLEVARTFLTRLRLAFFSSTIFRPRPICLANSDRRAA
jgi:hypothetical protein